MTEPAPLRPRSLTPEDVATRWQCSPDHVRKLIRTGALPAWRLGGKLLRIRPEEVEAFEQRNAIEPPPASSGPSVEDHVATLREVMADRRRRTRMGL